MNIIGSNQRQKDSSYEMLLKKSPHRNIKPNDFALKLVVYLFVFSTNLYKSSLLKLCFYVVKINLNNIYKILFSIQFFFTLLRR